jgi:VanZ family protein
MNIGTNFSQAGWKTKAARHLILTRLLAPLVMVAIWFLSSQSTLPQPKGIFGVDKIQHFIAYFVLAVVVGLWFSPERWQKWAWKPFFISVAIAALYGIIDEVHQYFVPGRESDVWDWLADSIGAVLGSLAILLLFRARAHKAGRADEAE